MESFWQLGDQLRGHTKDSEEQKWVMEATKLAEQTRSKANRVNNLYFSRGPAEMMPTRTIDYFPEEEKFEHLNISMLNLDSKLAELNRKSSFQENIYNPNELYLGSSGSYLGNAGLRVGRPKSIIDNQNNRDINVSSKIKTNNNNSNKNDDNNNALDKRFKTLPAAETLPRNEVLGGYIFVCNNDTMQEDLKRNLFGLPPRYRDSVRAITPGLPLFLYNYTTHQLHGIFEATSFGGSNIDPTAWEDKKCKGESRFPAQVRTRVRKVCEALEEDSFRPVLHHYDGPKFRLELSVPETLALLDLFEGENK